MEKIEVRFTTHLRNQITAVIGHTRRTGLWDHHMTEQVEKIIREHQTCPYCEEKM